MAGETSDEILQRVRGGELDARRILLTPDIAPGAADLTLAALLAPEPSVGELGEAAWVRLESEPGARIGDLEPDRRFWIADLLNFWQTAPGRRLPGHLPAGRHVREDAGPVLPHGRAGAAPGADGDAPGPQGELREHPRLRMRLRPRDAVLPRGVPRRAADRLRHHRRRSRLLCARVRRDPGHSQEDPAAIDLPGPFDLTWVGSLFTHVPEDRWIAFLDLLESVLTEQGLLLFTVQGRNVRQQLLSRQVEWDLGDEEIDQIVRDYDETGYGYADWSGASGYGTSLNRPSWVCAQIEDRPGLRLVGYREIGWGRQDVVICEGTGR